MGKFGSIPDFQSLLLAIGEIENDIQTVFLYFSSIYSLVQYFFFAIEKHKNNQRTRDQTEKTKETSKTLNSSRRRRSYQRRIVKSPNRNTEKETNEDEDENNPVL